MFVSHFSWSTGISAGDPEGLWGKWSLRCMLFSPGHSAPLLWFRHRSESGGMWEVVWLSAHNNSKVLLEKWRGLTSVLAVQA